MPPVKATVRTLWIAEQATYRNCQLSWDIASNTFTVYDPLNPAAYVIQESFNEILKVLHEYIEPSCITLFMMKSSDPEKYASSSPRLIFLFNKASSAVKFHEALLPLNKDYANCDYSNNTACACGGFLDIRAMEAASRKRRHEEDVGEPSTKRHRPAFFTTLKIPPHLQPRVTEILAKQTQTERSVNKSRAYVHHKTDTIVISSPLGPNRRQVRQKVSAPLPPDRAVTLPRRSAPSSGQTYLTTSASPSIPSPVTKPDLDTHSEKSLYEQFLDNQTKINTLNRQQEMLWQDGFDEYNKLVDELKTISVEEFAKVRKENEALKLEKTQFEEKLNESQRRLVQSHANRAIVVTQNTELRADIQLLKDLVGRVTGPLVQLDVNQCLTKIKRGEDPDAAIKASRRL